MILFVNGCVRENSRTLELARAVLAKENDTIEEIRLYPDGPEGLDAEKLARRDELLAAKEYDIVLVNIVADVIIGLAPVLPNFLTEKSTLICSGILDTRLQDVLDALKAAGLTVTKIMEQEDWRCVTACRKF